MRNLLLVSLLLTTAVSADPYTSKAEHFRVDFPGKQVRRYQKNPTTRAYLHRAGQGEYFVGVVDTDKPLTRYQAAHLVAHLDRDSVKNSGAHVREMTVAGRPALEINGLDDNGTPAILRIVPDGKRVYILGAEDYDLAASARFVNSFRLIP